MTFTFPGGDSTVTTESPQVSTTLPRNALPYRVRFGLQESCAAYFRSFSEALEMARAIHLHYIVMLKRPGSSVTAQRSVSLANHEREDMAEDKYTSGLTPEQQEQWEES